MGLGLGLGLRLGIAFGELKFGELKRNRTMCHVYFVDLKIITAVTLNGCRAPTEWMLALQEPLL